jgi:hypothetical protein
MLIKSASEFFVAVFQHSCPDIDLSTHVFDEDYLVQKDTYLIKCLQFFKLNTH